MFVSLNVITEEAVCILCDSGHQRLCVQRESCNPGCLSEVPLFTSLCSHLYVNSQPLSLINSQEADLPLVFGLASQRGIHPSPPLDFSQVLPLIRVSNKC